MGLSVGQQPATRDLQFHHGQTTFNPIGVFHLISYIRLRMVDMLRVCYLLLLCLYCPLLFSAGTPPQRVVVEHWPPWEIAEDANKEFVSKGLAVELVSELFARLEVPLILVTVPWKRALTEIEQGKSDLIPMIAKTKAREKYMLYTTEIFRDPILLAYSVDTLGTFQWDTWEDLTPYKFQLVRGYAYGKEWDQALKKYRYRHSKSISDEQSLRMLKGGRIDLIPLFYVNGTQLIADLQYQDTIKFAAKPVKDTTFYFGISKHSYLATRMTDINNAIHAMKKDGTFARILGHLYTP